MRIERRPYGDEAVQGMLARLDALYATIYGAGDRTPVDASEFEPPRGAMLVGVEDDGAAVAVVGWRSVGGGVAELKRLFVDPDRRGGGRARAMLRAAEADAAAAGVRRLVLETNDRHPEALALYRRDGYGDEPPFGVYQDEPGSVYLGRDLAGA